MIRLPQIPDRTPVKLTINVAPDLHQALIDYAAAYAAQYNRQESITDLVPAMLAAFLESDRAFVKARREGIGQGPEK